MRAILFSPLCALVLAAQPPADVPGYRTTRWGMKPQELLEALPGELELITPPSDGGNGRFVARVKGDLLQIGPAWMRIAFKAETHRLGLIEVVLSTDSAKRVDYTALQDLLMEKYGAPTNKFMRLDKQESLWTFKTTTIRLSQSYSSYGVITSITYSATGSAPGASLL